jgi:hypothetical protein
MGYLFCATGADIAVIISLIFCENEEVVFAGRQHKGEDVGVGRVDVD